MVSLCVNQLVFLYVFLVCNLSNAQFRHHTKLCPHTRTLVRSLARSQNTKTYCVCWMCPNLWVTWVVKSFASSVHFALSFYMCYELLRYRNLFIFFFSFIVRMRHTQNGRKKLYLISHGLHFNFRVGFFSGKQSIILKLIFCHSQWFAAFIVFKIISWQEQKMWSILIDWKC